ncbi:MAG TPA: xanthine dehydrogenase family protein molybdopterin-binding subunit [Patescibacteria group bacterium]|jgi:CO/xanthine dehydrogenase Mo-binding subunit|nr:xanthine dehydrogenase family protein molybdopterin-binding subunit [Patescibacteria group bacterium]
MATVMKTTREVKGVGLSIPRADGAEKVTGKTEYVADLKPKGMLHAKLLRSPHAHARIKRIDVSKAKALPGVRAVIVAADIPGLKKKAPTRAHAVLAIDRVVFVGQPVAAVAADELAIAEEACDLIQVDYEVLPAAVDPLDAMQVGAPPVAEAGTEADTSEALAHSGVAAAKSEAKPSKAVNISQQAKINRGDLAKAFAESDVVIEKTYRIPMVHQGYLEPHAVLAQWDQQGQLTLWASTQGSFNTRSEVADILGLEENQIKVIPMECGGGFGGKIRALCEPITAVLAKASGRPVRYVMTRREELDAGNPAPQVIIKLKTGCKRDGTLMALDADTIIESGAFSGAVLTMSAVFIASVYKFPNFEVRGFEVLTHKPSIAAYRAPTAPHTFFAIDSQMELMAQALGVDAVEFRMRHLMQEGDPMANGQKWQSNGAKQVLARIAEHPLWKNRKAWSAQSGKNGRGLCGTGLAVGGWIPGLQPTGATVRLNPDGSLTVLTGQVDIAGTNIALAQIAASAYGLDIDKVKITTGDTDVAPMTGLSAGSKTIYTVGTAVLEAAKDARKQTLQIAAAEMEAAVEDLEIEDGRVVVRGVPDKGVTLASIGKKGNLYMSKIPPVLGVSHPAFAVQAPAFAAELAKIEVDPDTGQTTIHDFVVVQDAGKAINPLGVEGQMQGGAVQSIGIALTEAMMYDKNGRLMNPSLLDYRKLTAADLPNIETIIVEVPAPAGPFGARGVGEPPIVPAPAALANAVHDATGVRLTELPLSPERIALAIAARS